MIRISLIAGLLLLLAPNVWGRPNHIQVAVSIAPQATFVRQIGGDRVQVVVLLPPGANPATFEPKVRTLMVLSKAKLYFRIHVPFENAWMVKFRSVNPHMKVVDTTKGITLVNNDPHTWLAPRLVAHQAGIICEALEHVDPSGKPVYEKNFSRFLEQIDTLEKKIETRLKNIKRRVFLTYHPCWGYFAREFGLVQLSIEQEGKAPGASNLAAIIRTARRNHLRCVFAQPQFDTRNARMIARQIHGRVVLLDPLAKNWEKNLLEVADKIARCLQP